MQIEADEASLFEQPGAPVFTKEPELGVAVPREPPGVPIGPSQDVFDSPVDRSIDPILERAKP